MSVSTSINCSQDLSIVHKIYSDFDQNPNPVVRSQFLDTSKAFDGKWHEGLLYKLKTIRISGDLPSALQTFLKNRFQRVVLNGQSSDWSPLKVEVPQGSI